MSNKTFNGRIQNKHDTEAHWNLALNFVPLAGEIIIYDQDSNYSYQRVKIGDGTTLVRNLPFVSDKLPEVTTSDSGKFLRVSSSGVWGAESIPNAENNTF